MTQVSILTGDIVASTQLGAQATARALGALETMAQQQAAWHGVSLAFTRHRGDGWQVALARPALVLRSLVGFAAALRQEGKDMASYMAVATGPLDAPLPADLNNASGPAFTGSGRLLDTMKTAGPRRLMALTGSGPRAAAIALADHLTQGWTPPQAQAVSFMLGPKGPPSYTDLAKTLGKSRQAVTKALDGAGFDALRTALEHYERPENRDD